MSSLLASLLLLVIVVVALVYAVDRWQRRSVRRRQAQGARSRSRGTAVVQGPGEYLLQPTLPAPDGDDAVSADTHGGAARGTELRATAPDEGPQEERLPPVSIRAQPPEGWQPRAEAMGRVATRRARDPLTARIEPSFGGGAPVPADQGADLADPMAMHADAALPDDGSKPHAPVSTAESPRHVPVSNAETPQHAAARSGQAQHDAPPATDTVERADAAAAGLDDEVSVEHVVVLVPEKPVSSERLVVLCSSVRHVGNKPITIEIERTPGRWEPLQSDGVARRVRFSVLLANRRGPLSAVEVSDFDAIVGAVAASIRAPEKPSDIGSVVERARQLDALAAQLDTQIDLVVESSVPLSSARLARLAAEIGLQDRGSQRYARITDSGDVLFTLMPGRSPERLDFVMDVPRTPGVDGLWRSMVDCANECARAVGGRVVDGAGRGMSVKTIEAVGAQLQTRLTQMRQVGLPAGSALALRVFS